MTFPARVTQRALAVSKLLFEWSSAIILPGVAVLTTVDTSMRYLFTAPLDWAQDVVGISLFLLFVLCLPYSMHGGFHVRMDLIYDNVSRGTRRALDAIGYIGALALVAVLVYRSWFTALRALRTHETTPSGELTLWPFHLVGALCFSLFLFVIITTLLWPQPKPERKKLEGE
ncbi:TRAP transporter small permease [Aminobacter sp. MSH1]|uniref:TRAP transporter small permease subunit n=1 Tax=Aminobacter sp. MSH1 TaxID=374606 RepID=UPI000D39FB0E|nr:TRAP transporter small permease [Aminobacter sp. MSH1]